mmetsp:Transcript_1753/g.2747  ORF Transcript_1753/g.2747 Transcript_1753/m.2747 type:complete len:131 (+) Transcript_1753:149-541(+)
MSKLNELLVSVQKFCTSDDFEAEFEAFAKEHSDTFASAVDYKCDGAEHPVEFFDVYRDYLSRFEGRIEGFIIDLGYSPKDFYTECKDILEEEDVFGDLRWFVEKLLAVSEYEQFFALMQSEMHKYQPSRK